MVSGGGASSPLFMQTFADVFGIPATRSTGAAGASLGAAICAAAAAGIYPDIETAAARMTRRARVVRSRRRQHGDLRADERDCLPGHQSRHGSAPRALVPDLPLSRPPKGRHHGTDQSRDRRGSAADPRLRERASPTSSCCSSGASTTSASSRTSSASTRCRRPQRWRWCGTPGRRPRCSRSRTSRESTSCRARAAPRPRAASRRSSPTRSCSTARR